MKPTSVGHVGGTNNDLNETTFVVVQEKKKTLEQKHFITTIDIYKAFCFTTNPGLCILLLLPLNLLPINRELLHAPSSNFVCVLQISFSRTGWIHRIGSQKHVHTYLQKFSAVTSVLQTEESWTAQGSSRHLLQCRLVHVAFSSE